MGKKKKVALLFSLFVTKIRLLVPIPGLKPRGFMALAYYGGFSEQKFSALKGGALYPAKFL